MRIWIDLLYRRARGAGLRRSRTTAIAGAGALAAALGAGCALVPSGHVSTPTEDVFGRTHGEWSVTAEDLDVQVVERQQIETASGEDLVRIEFSFVSYDGYVAEDDLYESTGTLYVPLDGNGRARAHGSGIVTITEFPPGAGRVDFPLLDEYGEQPAAELGIPAALVDVRGPVASRVGQFVNPDDPSDGVFRGEAQFAYAMLRSYQATGDAELLYEYQVTGAWLRAIGAVSQVLEWETGENTGRVLLTGERYGALSAVQAAAIDDRVVGVVVAGWPLHWADYHLVRSRRWEEYGKLDPLRGIQPSVWRDSRDVLSFLSSTRHAPDPGCPECEGTGGVWQRQFDIGTLKTSGRFNAALFLLEGDEDPDLPIDLMARASVPRHELEAPPPRVPPGADSPGVGPFAANRRRPFDDLRLLRGGVSTIVRADAAEAVRAWAQTSSGFRDLPLITATEEIRDGDLVITVHVHEGNASVTDVIVRTIETDPHRPHDFKAAAHRRPPESLAWRNVPAHYSGHTLDFGGRWIARTRSLPGANQAYSISVETRIGDAMTESSLPVRALWNRGDPAVGSVPW